MEGLSPAFAGQGGRDRVSLGCDAADQRARVLDARREPDALARVHGQLLDVSFGVGGGHVVAVPGDLAVAASCDRLALAGPVAAGRAASLLPDGDRAVAECAMWCVRPAPVEERRVRG